MSANSGFGNRRPAQRKAYISPDDLDSASPSPAQPARQVSGILFGLAIVACIGGGYVAAMMGFSRTIELPWRNNILYAGGDDSSKRATDVSIDSVHNNCKARSD